MIYVTKMASCDDRQWMLSLIQNSFVTTDDTGICEVILQGDEGKKAVCEFDFLLNMDDAVYSLHDEIETHSPDVASADSDLSHRHRSYTERKSEKLKKEREKSSRVKRIYWKLLPEEITDGELSEMFQRKALITRSSDTCDGEPPPKPTSLLSYLLKTCPPETNSFVEYSKFDGTIHNNVPRQQLNIFLCIGENPCSDYPLKVSVISSARVVDLIGLICWIYTKENRHPALIVGVNNYKLHFADEDGHVDLDFAPLERKDLMEKFGFKSLALMEQPDPENGRGATVTVNFADGAFSKVEIKNHDVFLKEVLDKSISRRKEITKIKDAGLDYHLEKEDEPGHVLDLDKTVAQVNCLEFAAVRDNSKRTNGKSASKSASLQVSVNSTFDVIWERKMGKFVTKIDISGDALQILPISIKGNVLFGVRLPPKVKYPIVQLVDCTKKELKKGKLEVSVTLQLEHSFKSHTFICEPAIGYEMMEKCKRLIKLNSRTHKKPFRRHNSLTHRRKPHNESNSFEV